jgi:hypothetical protein
VDPLVPATHDECFELLSRTLLLPGLDLQQFATKKSNIAEVGAIDPATKLNYQRCVSAGFYNTGAALYQSGKYSAATRFLSVGCLVGSHALAQHQLLLAELASTDNKEFWLQLEHQIFQRWDLLGSCFVKTGERQVSCLNNGRGTRYSCEMQQAYDAFMKAIRLFPINHFASISNDTADPKKRMLESSSLTRQVALTVERVTFLAINELLLPADQVPLNHALHPNGTQECTPEMCLFISVILEKQLEVLEKSKWKPHVRAALQPVLSGLSVVYKQSQRPAQVARMMVKTMELMYSAPMEDNTATAEETMSGLTALHVSQVSIIINRCLCQLILLRAPLMNWSVFNMRWDICGWLCTCTGDETLPMPSFGMLKQHYLFYNLWSSHQMSKVKLPRYLRELPASVDVPQPPRVNLSVQSLRWHPPVRPRKLQRLLQSIMACTARNVNVIIF